MVDRCSCPIRLRPDEDPCFICGLPLMAYDEWAALMTERYPVSADLVVEAELAERQRRHWPPGLAS